VEREQHGGAPGMTLLLGFHPMRERQPARDGQRIYLARNGAERAVAVSVLDLG
jgi:hypothetical protein